MNSEYEKILEIRIAMRNSEKHIKGIKTRFAAAVVRIMERSMSGIHEVLSEKGDI